MNDFFNRCLEINLNERSFKKRELEQDLMEKYLGGKGVGLSLLIEKDYSEDPLDQNNPLIFTTGPLTGTMIQTSARSAVITRSPLTGTFLDSHAGGHFGPAMRRSGWDYICIEGKSSSPIYLVISPERVEFVDATFLWGKDAFVTEKWLVDNHKNAKVACIGQAGENLVRYAAIGTGFYRHYGRGGSGAVMGSKKLKAIVVKGNLNIEYHNPENFSRLSKDLVTELRESPSVKNRTELGTMMWIRMGQEVGHFLPTRNFQAGEFDEYENISSETMRKELDWTNRGCFGCGIIKCSKLSKWKNFEMEGPEYETAAFLGSGCEIGNAKDVAYANWLCDKYGLDTISTGVSISFAMECAEKGLLSQKDNQRITFGSSNTVHTLINEIAMRKDIGNILAEGTRKASQIIGKDSEYFAIHTAGMELSGVNPLGCYSMGLALVTSDFASHTRLWTATDEMMGKLTLEMLPKYIKTGQDEVNVRNSLIICDFLPISLTDLCEYYNSATGFEHSINEFTAAGERIQTLSRLYNIEKGRTHEQDLLPPRFYEELSFSGLMKGKKIPIEFFKQQVQDIYSIRGWDNKGKPTKKVIKKLGINYNR